MTQRLRIALFVTAVFLIAGAIGCGGVEATQEEGAGKGPAESRIEIPLEDGRLDVAVMLRVVFAAMGRPAPAGLNDLRWTIDVHSALGKAQLRQVERITGGAMRLEVEAQRMVVVLDAEAMGEAREQRREAVGAWLEDAADRLAVYRKHRFGLTFVTKDDPYASPEAVVAGEAEAPPRVVVLVHGLDDPGWMWRDMIPALRGADHIVARFEYANDGPISDAADELALALMNLKRVGVRRVDIVAHSMGGLVSRDVLTRRAYYGGDGAGGERLPAVDRLIMCGTPNAGSKMARLRGISELKEQITRAFSDEGSWLGGLADGRGEAAVDLLPGSEFLERLNARPPATHTKYTIIAGRMSPVSAEAVGSLGAKARQLARSADAPKWLRNWIDSADRGATTLVDEAVRGLGDGCVTIDSARLEGVDDFIIVEANHVELIVDVNPLAKDVPPAVPIVLERLAREEAVEVGEPNAGAGS